MNIKFKKKNIEIVQENYFNETINSQIKKTN